LPEPVDIKDAGAISSLSMMEITITPAAGYHYIALCQTGPAIYGDRMRLEQVIINLLRNALDATKNGPGTALKSRLCRVMWRCPDSTRDNGRDDPDELFEPFYTNLQAGDGTGLALLSHLASNDFGDAPPRNSDKQGCI
jgi:two-component system C4-dicarboxylate transport sensor histidine kinase DctB